VKNIHGRFLGRGIQIQIQAKAHGRMIFISGFMDTQASPEPATNQDTMALPISNKIEAKKMSSTGWFLQTQQVSWQHYVWAFAVSLLAPLLIICFQSTVVRSRGFISEKAMLFEAAGRFSDFEIWFWANKLWIGTVATTTFLIICPFLKFRVLRWLVLICLLTGWTYLFCRM
jgi:hypothetical protein